MLLDAFRRPLLFVGGKGGVGKTSLASALAVARARTGERVLVVSTDPAHNLGHLWGIEAGDAPARMGRFGGGVVDGIEIDPQATIDRHLTAVEDTMLTMLPERQHGPAHAHLERARHAPGSHESAVLERIAEFVEAGRTDYDAVIFDTAPSGHTLRLLALPGQLAGWTETLLRNRDRSERFSAAMRGLTGAPDAQAGAQSDLRRALQRRRDRFAGMQQAVADPAQCGFAVVFTAEALPVAETLEVVANLRGMGVAVGALIANRRSPADAGELLAARRTVEDGHLRRVRDAVPDAAVIEIPLIAGELTGVQALVALADTLVEAERI